MSGGSTVPVFNVDGTNQHTPKMPSPKLAKNPAYNSSPNPRFNINGEPTQATPAKNAPKFKLSSIIPSTMGPVGAQPQAKSSGGSVLDSLGGALRSGLDWTKNGLEAIPSTTLHAAEGVPGVVKGVPGDFVKAYHDVAAMGPGLVQGANQIFNPHHSGVDFLHGLVDALAVAPVSAYNAVQGKGTDVSSYLRRINHWAEGGYGQPTWGDVGHEWGDFVHHPLRTEQNAAKGKYGPAEQANAGLLYGTANAYKTTLEHPGRDPFMTGLTLLPGAGAAAKLGIAGKVGMAAEDAGAIGKVGAAAKAFVEPYKPGERILNVPKITKTNKIKTEPVQLTAAGKPLGGVLQKAHDKILEGAMNKRTQGVVEGTAGESLSPALKYAQKRVGYSINETSRRAEQTSGALPTMLDRIARTGTGKLWNRGFGKGLSKAEGNLALILRSAGLLPHEARDFWNESIMNADNPALVQHHIDTAHSLHQKGVLAVNKKGVVAINPAFKKLQSVDQWVKKGQSVREDIIRKNKLLTPKTLADRLTLVSRKVLGEETPARPGQNYFSLATLEKELPKYPRTAYSPKMGDLRKPTSLSRAHPATGEGVAQGWLPGNMIHSVAHSTRDMVQFANKLRYRKVVGRVGSNLKTGMDDVLVRNPNDKAWAKELTPQEKIAVGTHKDATIDPISTESLRAEMEQRLNYLFPFRDPTSVLNDYKGHSIGSKAAEGHVWVPRRYLGDALDTPAAKGKWSKGFDNVNQAVTAATVYFKVSHVPQRLATNATTSLVSGALLSRKSIALAMKWRDELGPEDFNRATAATGTHGYTALPHGEGSLSVQNVVGRASSQGAGAYARRIDSPFRWLNLVHEARKAGIDTSAEFKKMLDYAENPTRRFANRAKYEQVYRRANSVSMAYDRVTTGERNSIARGLWFYPWVKAATVYGGHTIMEHPTGSSVAVNQGVQEEQAQKKAFGNLPDWAFGLMPVGKNKSAQPGYLLPFQTGGQALDSLAHPEQILQSNLNPVYSALLAPALAAGGIHTGNPAFGSSPGAESLGALLGSTPEWRAAADAINPSYAAKKTHVYPHNALDDLFSSFLGGPSYPRTTNKKALNFDYALEHGKFKQIYVPNKKKH